eukprot:TRINITY_DN20719_c0_g1_i2.p1 TRINITY_DN20719_c0_g1~~TRINITY_DN20719_c0_g1_i2.p1  ORF type:complete len:340 (+),score=65.03 TRINITY_DN20719_c0_g1_i2:201-1220(+)
MGWSRRVGKGRGYVWNSTNAENLLAYLSAHKQELYGFELGNEVNNNRVKCNQTAAQQASAQRVFAGMVSNEFPEAKLIGPDSGGVEPEEWLRAYLPLVTSPALHAVTHHVYAGITRANYNHATQLDGSLSEIAWYSEVVNSLAPNSQMWAGEDGPTGGGSTGTCGSDSACGTYSTTLWYADDLALRAKHGFVQYQRQDLIGGHYGLTNTVSGEQVLRSEDAVVLRPDYWLNFLWKRTLGQQVLNMSSTSAQVRVYGFQGAASSPDATPACSGAGAVQLLLINLNDTLAVTVDLTRAVPAGRHDYSAWTLSASTGGVYACLLYTSPSPRDRTRSRMPSSA